jgi:hypothetical protein
LLRPIEREWPQENRIDEAEDHRVRTDAKRQRQHGSQREARRLPQHPEAEAQILGQRVLPGPARSLPRFFTKPQLAAEFDARLPFRRGSIKAAENEIVGPELHVRAKLLIDLVIVRTPRKGAHIFSGLVASAADIAWTSRFQSLVS